MIYMVPKYQIMLLHTIIYWMLDPGGDMVFPPRGGGANGQGWPQSRQLAPPISMIGTGLGEP